MGFCLDFYLTMTTFWPIFVKVKVIMKYFQQVQVDIFSADIIRRK